MLVTFSVRLSVAPLVFAASFVFDTSLAFAAVVFLGFSFVFAPPLALDTSTSLTFAAGASLAFLAVTFPLPVSAFPEEYQHQHTNNNMGRTRRLLLSAGAFNVLFLGWMSPGFVGVASFLALVSLADRVLRRSGSGIDHWC